MTETPTIEKTYDSGLPTSEDHTVADEIEAGVHVHRENVAEATRTAEALDLAQFRPASTLIVKVADVMFGGDEDEAALYVRDEFAPYKSNPRYVTQMWLNEDGPTWTNEKGHEVPTATEVLVLCWFQGEIPVVAYLMDEDINREKSDYADWSLFCYRPFTSEGQAVRWLNEARRTQRDARRNDAVRAGLDTYEGSPRKLAADLLDTEAPTIVDLLDDGDEVHS